jgi:PAS domain S-box-containing protein
MKTRTSSVVASTPDPAWLAQVARFTTHAVIVTHPDSRIRWVNPGFTRMSGHTLAEVLGKTPAQVLSSGKSPLEERRLLEAIAAHQPCRLQLINRARDGHEYWADVDLHPILDADGSYLGSLEIAVDISAQKRSSELLENIQQHLPCGLAVFDSQRRLLLFNPLAQRLFDLPDGLLRPGVTMDELARYQAERGDFGDENSEQAVARRLERMHQGRLALERQQPDGRWIKIDGAPMPGGGMVLTYQDTTDLRNALAEAVEQRRQLNALVGNLPGMAYRCANDPTWTLLFASEGVLALTGYQPAELLDNRVLSFAQLIHPDDRDRVRQRTQDALAARASDLNEYRIVTRQGEVRWVMERYSGHFSPDGAVLFIEGFVQDVTARRQAELELKQANERLAAASAQLHATLDNIAQGVLMVGPDHKLLVMSRRAMEILELPDRLVGAPFDEVVRFQTERGDHGPNLERVDEAARPFVRGGADQAEQAPALYHRTTRSGRTLEVRTTMLPGGGWVRTFTDVTEYMLAMKLRIESEALWRIALDGAGDGVWDIDYSDGKGQVAVSDGWCRLFGYPAPQPRRSLAEFNALYHPDDLARLNAAHDASQRGAMLYSEHRMLAADGSWKWVSSRGEVVARDAQGAMLRAIGVHSDIGTRKEAETQMARQMAELRRWQEATLGREARVLDLKREVNQLLESAGLPARYGTAGAPAGADTP